MSGRGYCRAWLMGRRHKQFRPLKVEGCIISQSLFGNYMHGAVVIIWKGYSPNILAYLELVSSGCIAMLIGVVYLLRGAAKIIHNALANCLGQLLLVTARGQQFPVIRVSNKTYFSQYPGNNGIV